MLLQFEKHKFRQDQSPIVLRRTSSCRLAPAPSSTRRCRRSRAGLGQLARGSAAKTEPTCRPVTLIQLAHRRKKGKVAHGAGVEVELHLDAWGADPTEKNPHEHE